MAEKLTTLEESRQLLLEIEQQFEDKIKAGDPKALTAQKKLKEASDKRRRELNRPVPNRLVGPGPGGRGRC